MLSDQRVNLIEIALKAHCDQGLHCLPFVCFLTFRVMV